MQDLFGNLAREILGGRRYGGGNTRSDVGAPVPGQHPLSPFLGGDPFSGRWGYGNTPLAPVFHGGRGLLERPGAQELPMPALGFRPQGAAPPLPGQPPVDLTAVPDYPSSGPVQQFTPPGSGQAQGTPAMVSTALGLPAPLTRPSAQPDWLAQFFGSPPPVPGRIAL